MWHRSLIPNCKRLKKTLKKIQEKVAAALPEGVVFENVEIWFQDEARVGQRGTVTRLWAKKGSRLRVIRQQQFEYAYIFGAVCPQKDRAVGLVLPTIGTYCMQKHLEEISKAVEFERSSLVSIKQHSALIEFL